MKFEKMFSKMNNYGITLIALVVTIVVLLILAGITIQLVFSDGGILNQANNAKLKTEEATAKEKLQLVLANAIVQKAINPEFDYEEFIQKNLPDAEILDNIIIVDGWAFEIDKDTLEIITSIGPASEIVYPEVNVSVITQEDKRTAEIKISAIEATNGIEKIEILLGKDVIETISYEWTKEAVNATYQVSYNGEYVVKVYSKLKVSKIAKVNEILAQVKFSPNGNEVYQKQTSVTLNVDESLQKVKTIRYVWSQSAIETPESIEFISTCQNNSTVKNATTLDGKWYLWVLVQFENGGESTARSNVFHFDNTGPTITVSPLKSDDKPSSLIVQAQDAHSDVERIEVYVGENQIASGKNEENSLEFEYEDENWQSFTLTVKSYDSLENCAIVDNISIIPEYRWDEYGVIGTNTWVVSWTTNKQKGYSSTKIIQGTAGDSYTANTSNQTFTISDLLGTNLYIGNILGTPTGVGPVYVVSSDKKSITQFTSWYYTSSTKVWTTYESTGTFVYDPIRMDESSKLSTTYSTNVNLHENDAKERQ